MYYKLIIKWRNKQIIRKKCFFKSSLSLITYFRWKRKLFLNANKLFSAVARLFCDRRKFDPTLVSIDVSAHRRLCGRR
jgi:hypothetical protein